MKCPDFFTDCGAIFFENGIWYSRTNQQVSYPEEGNQLCYQLEDESFWFRHRNNCIVCAVKKYSHGEIFFDIGGGNGFVAAALQNIGSQVVMIEPGKQGCINARNRGISTVICGTFQDINLKNESIAACGFFDVIEHVESDRELLHSLYPFIKPGGKIYISVPAYTWLWSQEDEDAGHYRRYTIKSLADLLQQSGFSVLYQTYLFAFLPFPILVARTLPYQLHFRNAKANHANNHTNKRFFPGIFEKLLDNEVRKVNEKKSIPFGSSCFIIAVKQ